MTLFTRVRLTLLIAATVAAVTFVGAQQSAIPEAVQKATLDQTVPVDPLITVGTLPNGLRYYIRANGQPQDRAELRLVVNAGSVLEDDDQRGLAHFVEHMSFNGTLHFPRQDLGNFMQSLGMRFGAHVNAHTSFDETVYALQIPTTDAAVIDRSLLILEDWARDVSFDPVEIDKERGVILEEWRLGLGAAERIQNEQFPILLRGSRYAERLPIGRARHHSERQPRQAEAVLRGLVPARSDGRHRRRRFRQVGDRGRNQNAFRLDPGGVISKTEACLRRAGSPRDLLLGDHRSRSDEYEHQRIEQDDGTPAGDGRRIPAGHGRAVVQRHAVRTPR